MIMMVNPLIPDLLYVLDQRNSRSVRLICLLFEQAADNDEEDVADYNQQYEATA